MRWICGFFLLLVIGIAAAEVYQWTDSKGNVHYSDVPHAGAKVIKLPALGTVSSPAGSVPIPASQAEKEPAPAESESEYKSIEIIQPRNEDTLRNNQGYVPVVVNTEPALKAGDKLQLLFDGQPLSKPQDAPVFALQNVLRGTHTIAVQIVNASGEVLNLSETVTIYMHRPTVGMVPQTRPAQ